MRRPTRSQQLAARRRIWDWQDRQNGYTVNRRSRPVYRVGQRPKRSPWIEEVIFLLLVGVLIYLLLWW